LAARRANSDHSVDRTVLAPLTKDRIETRKSRGRPRLDRGRNSRKEDVMDNRSSEIGGQFSGATALKESLRNSATSVGASVSESAARARDAVGAAANDAVNAAGSDLQSLRTDLNRLKDTVSAFMAQATAEATKSARAVSADVASRVGDVADDVAQRGTAMASAATDQAKSAVSEFESMVRRNPIGAVAGAVMVGILIGTLGRRR
jgi:ElaB/YqjD/DUF883 family membrane-anchored ribosome-binding protein